jgi:hypothetical protein
MGAPAIFEKQIEIKLLHPASTLESRIQVKLCRQLLEIDLTAFLFWFALEQDRQETVFLKARQGQISLENLFEIQIQPFKE